MGRKMSNGTYSGLVGMLVRDEIDVIVSDLTINEERSDVLSFSHPILSSKYERKKHKFLLMPQIKIFI